MKFECEEDGVRLPGPRPEGQEGLPPALDVRPLLGLLRPPGAVGLVQRQGREICSLIKWLNFSSSSLKCLGYVSSRPKLNVFIRNCQVQSVPDDDEFAEFDFDEEEFEMKDDGRGGSKKQQQQQVRSIIQSQESVKITPMSLLSDISLLSIGAKESSSWS